jgi:hypothetical protein
MRYRKNIIGPQVRKLREERAWTLYDLATEFARQGLFISEEALDRVESQREFVGSVEVWAFANLLQTGAENLYPPNLSTSDVLGCGGYRETIRAISPLEFSPSIDYVLWR